MAPDDLGDRIACATYTHARRHPMVLGQIGGWTPPFQLTPAQIGVLLVTLVLEAQTWRMWGSVLPPALSVVLAIGVPLGMTWAVRRGRVEGRSLVRAAGGYLTLLSRRGMGQVGGRPYRKARPSLLGPARVFVAADPWGPDMWDAPVVPVVPVGPTGPGGPMGPTATAGTTGPWGPLEPAGMSMSRRTGAGDAW